MKEKMKDFISVFIGVFIIMIMFTFAIITATLPLTLMSIYDNTWYCLLYFVLVPAFFACLTLIK